MKRTMSILLALSLLLLLFSIPAGAESNGEDELFSVARAAFPEYASKIQDSYELWLHGTKYRTSIRCADCF